MGQKASSFPPLSPPSPDFYLDLLKRALTASHYPESSWKVVTGFRSGDSGLGGTVGRG